MKATAPASILAHFDHRPYPRPDGGWIMYQSWHDLLFAHWPLDASEIAAVIPSCLPVDQFQGSAWLGIVPFRMTDVRLRGTPPLPWLSTFPELNVRTYVTVNDKPGVYFFSLDAANPVAVAVARRWFHLPYFNARMQCITEGDTVHYRSVRTHRHAHAAELKVRYGPLDTPLPTEGNELARWLTERYCLYTTDRSGQLYCGDIHHQQWPLRSAFAEFASNTMAEAAGLTLPSTPPLLHFSKRLDVLIWPLKRCPCAL